MSATTRTRAGGKGIAPKAIDGIVPATTTGRRGASGGLGFAWILMARTDDPVEEFFLDDPFGDDTYAAGEDPVAWICREVSRDGTVRIGVVDLEIDRFVSQVLGSHDRGCR